MLIRHHTPSGIEPRDRPFFQPARLRTWVEALAHPRHFWAEAAANRAVGERIANELSRLGARVEIQGPYRNVVAVPGRYKSGPLVLIGAHYDSVPNCPGADDNASGVAILLECARALGRACPEAAIGYVAFNAEEDGMLGSGDFVGKGMRALGLDVASIHVLEMCGFRATAHGSQKSPLPFLPPGLSAGTFVALIGQGKSNRSARAAMRSASSPGLHRVAIETVPRAHRALPDLARSDHAPFWNAGVPAVLWTDTGNFRNPNYHERSDTPDTLDYSFMGNVCELLCAHLVQEHSPR